MGAKLQIELEQRMLLLKCTPDDALHCLKFSDELDRQLLHLGAIAHQSSWQ